MISATLLVLSLFAPEGLVEDLCSLQREAEVLAALQRADLTPEESEVLAGLVRRAHEIRHRYDDEAAAILAEQSASFARFREEDLHNVGFARDTERCTGEADHAGKELMARLAAEVNPVSEEAASLLNLPGRRAGAGPGAELRRIHEQRWPKPDEVAVALMSGAAASRFGLDCGPHDALESVQHEVGHLRDDINLLNLINGLNFSEEQLAALAATLETLQAARDASFEEQRARLERAAQGYRDAIDRMQAGEDVTAELRRLGRQSRSQPGAEAEATALDAVLAILSEGQRDVMYDYNPCLIPPQDLRDPVRVGQASTSSGAIRLMERLRRIPEEVWSREGRALLDRALVEIETRNGAFPDSERDDVRSRLAEFANRVRSLDEMEFQLQQEPLAEEAVFLNRQETLERQALESRPREDTIAAKVRQHLLHPRALDLIRTRLEQVRRFEPEPVDLTRGPVAPSCRDGRCAIDR